MIDSLLNESKNNNQKSALDNYSIKELIDLYITYARPKYFIEHNNMRDILEYISLYVINNLLKNSFVDNLDLYTKLMMEIHNLEDMIESTNNIIRIRDYNLQDDFFLEMQSKTFKLDKEIYIEKYQEELYNFKNYNALYKQILTLLDNFQKNMLLSLNNYIDTLPNEEKNNLLIDINKKIEENSLEINNRIELRQDRKKLELQSRFKDISVSELFDSLDTTYLKEQNYVFNQFQGVLKDNKKNK